MTDQDQSMVPEYRLPPELSQIVYRLSQVIKKRPEETLEGIFKANNFLLESLAKGILLLMRNPETPLDERPVTKVIAIEDYRAFSQEELDYITGKRDDLPNADDYDSKLKGGPFGDFTNRF